MSYDPNQPPPPNFPPQGPPPGPQMDIAKSAVSDSNLLLILSILGFFCCFLLNIYTLIKSNEARSSGMSDGKVDAAFFISVAAMVLWVIGLVARFTILR